MNAIRDDKNDNHYTYADYAQWDDDTRCELIDGVPYAMAAPSIAHQRICSELHGQLWQFLKGKPCEVFAAPVDVCLNAAGDEDDIVVQPDILIVCDKSKLDGKSVNGAPDMVIEILSPSTASRDCIIKHQKYMKAGVREYWIVDPDSKTVQVIIPKDDKYEINTYTASGSIPVHVLEGCAINLTEVFEGI